MATYTNEFAQFVRDTQPQSRQCMRVNYAFWHSVLEAECVIEHCHDYGLARSVTERILKLRILAQIVLEYLANESPCKLPLIKRTEEPRLPTIFDVEQLALL